MIEHNHVRWGAGSLDLRYLNSDEADLHLQACQVTHAVAYVAKQHFGDGGGGAAPLRWLVVADDDAHVHAAKLHTYLAAAPWRDARDYTASGHRSVCQQQFVPPHAEPGYRRFIE